MTTSDIQKADAETDFLVVGAGAGGMTGAIAASDRGLQVIVIEKTAQFGGTTAMSGGAIWVPNNLHMQGAGVSDSRAEGLTYMKAAIGGRTRDSLIEAYLDAAPAMVRELDERSDATFEPCAEYCDYYPDLPGGKPGARTLEASPMHGAALGDEFHRLRLPHPQELIFGRISATAVEARQLLFGGLHGYWLAVKLIFAYVFNVRAWFKYGRSPRLTLGNALAARLRLSLLRRKVPLWYETALQELWIENGVVVGALVVKEGTPMRIRARKGVLLASGGFAGNLGMRQANQQAPLGTQWTAASPADEGDGIRAGVRLGAGTDLLEDGWWTPTTVVPGEKLPWLLVIEKALPGSIIVNRLGKRFVNEAAPYIDVVNGMFADHARTQACIPAYLIMDARNRRRYPCGPLLPAQPEFTWRKEWKDKWISKAATLPELARKIGVDEAGLMETLAAFNPDAKRGVDPLFHRGESLYDRYYSDPTVKPNSCLSPLEKGPFYAIQVWPGDLGTKGGLKTDEQARVVNESGAPIAGLYAAGNNMASIMGNTYPGAGSTIGPSMVFGYLAALHAANLLSGEGGGSRAHQS